MSLLSEINCVHAEIAKLNDKLKLLQAKCAHPVEGTRTKEVRASSEWDSHAWYKTYYHCDICGKDWESEAYE